MRSHTAPRTGFSEPGKGWLSTGSAKDELVKLATRLIMEEALEGAGDAIGPDYWERGTRPGQGYCNLDADHRQAYFGDRTEQPLRQRSGFQADPLKVVGRVRQHRLQSVRFAPTLLPERSCPSHPQCRRSRR